MVCGELVIILGGRGIFGVIDRVEEEGVLFFVVEGWRLLVFVGGELVSLGSLFWYDEGKVK